MYSLLNVNVCLLASCYLPPGKGAKYCDEYVCLFACLSVCPLGYLRNHTPNFTNFCKCWVLVLTMVVARPSSCGVVVPYVLSVLWMTACWPLRHVMCIPKRQQDRVAKTTVSILTEFRSMMKTKYSWLVAPGSEVCYLWFLFVCGRIACTVAFRSYLLPPPQVGGVMFWLVFVRLFVSTIT